MVNENEDDHHDHLIAEFLPRLSDAANSRGVVCGHVRVDKSYIPKQVARGIEMSYVFPKRKSLPARIEMWIYHRKHSGGVEASKELFEHFLSKKDEIEESYGGPLNWNYEGRKTTYSIQQDYPEFQLSKESEWDEWIDRIVSDMKRLDDSLVPFYINIRN